MTNKRRQGTTIIKNPINLHEAFFDYEATANDVTSTAVQYSLLTTLLSATGLAQQFPQHAMPFLRSTGYGLRQSFRLVRMEYRFTIVGAQSNAILSADIYNVVRIAMFTSGKDYSAVNALYLNNSPTSGTNLADVNRVLFDKTFAMATNAWNPSSGYNSPSVKIVTGGIRLNDIIHAYSSNASGSGAAWDTNGKDYLLNWVSDSSITPHPQVTVGIRFYFEYLMK